jgi:hypothetical protein
MQWAKTRGVLVLFTQAGRRIRELRRILKCCFRAQRRNHMALRQYFPISVAVFVLVLAATRYFSVPFAPFALALLTGETLLGFQIEDHKAWRFLKELFKK